MSPFEFMLFFAAFNLITVVISMLLGIVIAMFFGIKLVNKGKK